MNENLFVSISSPSSSKYESVDDLKSPEKAAERTKQQYLRELLSTRLGVKRTTEIVSAGERIGPDGRKYYDLEVIPKFSLKHIKLNTFICLQASFFNVRASSQYLAKGYKRLIKSTKQALYACCGAVEQRELRLELRCPTIKGSKQWQPRERRVGSEG